MAEDIRLPSSWLLLVYRVPSEPSKNRVAIWRDMKRMGALYLQNCVCLLPAFPGLKPKLKAVAAKIDTLGGSSNTFELRKIDDAQLGEIIESFRALSDREYSEIIEECVTKFQKEIEFERFRQNFSYEEAEEIFSDLEKIKDWLARVVERDWFGCPKRRDAEKHVAESEALYEAFERECFAHSGESTELGRGPGDERLIKTAANPPTNHKRRPKARAAASR